MVRQEKQALNKLSCALEALPPGYHLQVNLQLDLQFKLQRGGIAFKFGRIVEKEQGGTAILL